MSRYKIECKNPAFDVFVGWDRPLETFFGQVLNPEAETDLEMVVLWCGANWNEVPTVAKLAEMMREYADLTEEVAARLNRDQAANPHSQTPGRQRELIGKILKDR